MKLKKLKIHNIASIADAEIDFEGWQLRDESIFLICGETGSGKTTILDAICLALYNRTPRLSQASIRDSYVDVNGESITLTNPVQYVRKGSWEASIELDFESGGKFWKSIWSTHRANRNPEGKFQTITWELLDIGNGISSKGSEAETVTGLSFDEFRRTTMLAQGEFTAFLKSRDDEKSAILEKITGTGIYKKIGKLIGEKFREASTVCNSKSETIRALKENILDEAEEARIKAEIAGLKAKADKLERERTEHDRIAKSLEEIPRLEKEISGHRENLEKSSEECSRLKGSIAYAEDFLRNKEDRISELERYFASVSEHSGMYTGFEGIRNALEKIEESEKRISEAGRSISTLKTTLAALETEKKLCLEVSRQKEEESCRKSEELKNLTDQQAARNPESLRKELDAIGIIRALLQKDEEHTILRAEDERVQAMFRETSQLYERVKESNTQWAKDARAGLTVGGECPVCGQVIATQEYLESISDAHFESVLRPVQEALKLRQEEKDRTSAKLLECVTQIKVLKERLQMVCEGKEFTDISDARYNEVSRQLKACDKAAEEITLATKEFSSLLDESKKAEKALTDVCVKFENCKVNLQSQGSIIETETTRIAEATSEAAGKISITGWKEIWSNDRQAFIDRLRNEAKKYADAQTEYRSHNGVIGTIREGMTSIRLCYKEILSLMPSFADVPCGESVKTDRLESRLNELKSDISRSLTGISDARTLIDGHKKTAGRHEYKVIRKRLEDITPELNVTNQAIGSYAKTLEDSIRNRKGLEEDLKLLEKLEKDRDQWKALNDVFGKKDGDYFQKIAQGFIMNDILSKANFYLKTMSGRYRLEAQPGTLNILMIDLEQGGVPRSTSTISGGESFIISLALALGLSSSGTGKISADILFIDEGFGSLSEDYLNTVIETLERLHDTSGKKVGIISHVEALRQRINTKILTTRTNGSTSKVEIKTGDE